LVRAFRPGRAGGAEAPSDTSRSTSRGLTGQGPAGSRRPAPRVWRRTRTMTHVPLEMPHLSRDPTHPRRELRPNPIRSDTSCRVIAARQMESLTLCGRRPSFPERVRNEPVRYASDDPAARALISRVNERPSSPRDPARPAFAGPQRDQGPLHPDHREEVRDRLHPRCLPSRSHPDVDLGLSPWVGRWVGPCPQIVTNLWRTHGAVAISGQLTLRPGCLDGPPAAWARSPMMLKRAGARSATPGMGFEPHHRAGVGPTSGCYPERTVHDGSADP